MSQNSNNTPDEQEVDLSAISRKVGGMFQDLNTAIFKAIQFIIKNIIIVGVLFVIGVGIGMYLDKTQKSYDNQIIVTPNFNSVDYLYSKVQLLNSKIKQGDTVFLKSIGINEPKKIGKVEIKPIVDIYRFINNSEQNFDLLKLMSEDGDLKKIVEENATSKNYPFHLIFFSSKKPINYKTVVEPILNFLNDSDYFGKVKKEALANVKIKMQANDTIIRQIDDYLNGVSDKNGVGSKSDMVNISENSQLNDVIETKDKLIKEQGENRIALISMDKIIKESSVTLNIQNNESLNGNLKLVLPFLFIFIFILFSFFRSFYKKQSLKAKQATA